MIAWLQSLDTLSTVFACIAFPTTLILLLQIVMTLIGLGDNGDVADVGDNGIDGVFGGNDPSVDVETDFNTDAPFHFLTLRGCVAFLVAFGWVGLSLRSAGLAWWGCLLLALFAGAIMMTVVALLLRGIARMQSDGTMNIRLSVGLGGTVYLTVPPARTGHGKVNILLQGAYRELDAVTDSAEPLKTGTEVTVCAISGGDTLVVEKR